MKKLQTQLRYLIIALLPALGVATLTTGCEKDTSKSGKKNKKKDKKKKSSGSKKKKKKNDDDDDDDDKKKKKKKKKSDKKKKSSISKKKKKKKKKKSYLANRSVASECAGKIQACIEQHATCKATASECASAALNCLSALDVDCLPGAPSAVELDAQNQWVKGLTQCVNDPDMHECVERYDECVGDDASAEKQCFSTLETCMKPLFSDECTTVSE